MASDSIQQIDSTTKFESMSNELLIELFEYYDLYSLYYSFGSLNSRIDRIIYRCQVCVNFDEVKRTDFVDFIRDILPNFNPKNIRSLHASNPNQIAILADDKSLSYFTHIRSLCLNNVETHMIEHILSRIDFSYLEYVSLNKYKDVFCRSPFIIQQFFDSNRFRFLRTYRHFRSALRKLTSVVLLEHVLCTEISDPNDFLNFLHQAPYLKYIRTALYFRLDYSHAIYLSPIPCYSTLRHLNLELRYYVCIKTITYLFQCVPELCHLKLDINSFTNLPLIDPIFWQTVFGKHLVKLKRLSLVSEINDRSHPIDPLWDVLIDQVQVNEQIKQSKYWSSHQWNATFTSTAVTQHFGHHEATFQVT